jgi:hypothetical protein
MSIGDTVTFKHGLKIVTAKVIRIFQVVDKTVYSLKEGNRIYTASEAWLNRQKVESK